LQELEQAQRQYQIAIKGNVSHAYNNLARLLIQDGNYAQAAVLLLQGIDWADQGESPLEIRYSLFKNLGWARFAQGERDAEAQQWLNVAISILENATEVEALYIKHPASAYCLMAQVLERQQRPAAEVLEFWQKCSDTGSSYNAEEDPWLHMARQRLGLN
jgi:tetratricopeptide (TPR) repeat protein